MFRGFFIYIYAKAPIYPSPNIAPAPMIWPRLVVANNSGKFRPIAEAGPGKAGPCPLACIT